MSFDGNDAAGKRAKVASIEEATTYWRERLSDAAHIQLPTDFPVDDTQFAESEVIADVDEATCKEIIRYTLAKDVKPFTVVMGAFAILLHKYTREEALAIGSSSTSANPLILRVNVTGTDTLESVFSRTREAEEAALMHEVPFDALMNSLFPTAEARQNMYSLFHVRVLNAVDVSERTLDLAKCDWTLYVEQTPDSRRLLPLRLRLAYNSVIYSQQRIIDCLEQLQLVIRQFLAASSTLVEDVSLLTEGSALRLPNPGSPLDDSWNGAIFEHLSAKAAASPHRTLIVQGETTYTYGQVDELSNRLANYLVQSGVNKEDRVAIYAHRSAALVVGIMGILKSGATFTVVDPAYPIQRQIIYLKVAQPRAIVSLAAAGPLNDEVQQFIDTELSLCGQLSNLSMEVLGQLEGYSAESCGVSVGPDNIGTLSFTSGSTGLPKAVRGRHISLTHFYPWMAQEFGMGAHDRFSMLSGIAHDPIQRDIFTPIFFGAEIHIPSADDIGNPGQLAQWVADHRVTVTHLTPAMGQLLTANATAIMHDLRVSLFVGDVLTKRDIQRLFRLAPNVNAVNMYGTTETQRAVSFLKIPNDNSIRRYKEILPSGQGMKDVQLLVLTPKFKMAGVGELAELYVRSPHLSAGYLGPPELSAEKFLTNPFTNDPRDRYYRTGDLGRYMPNGVVECIGRADDQVKIRGFRIELGEIDTYLSQIPCIRENRTLVMRDAGEEKQIISFFVPVRAGEYDIDEIRRILGEKLPYYAVPTIFCPLAQMPLTPNGKIDKNRLPYPDTAVILMNRPKHSADESDAQPLTPLQKELMGIWEEVLGRPVHPKDNFFEVGGHSILATRLTFQMRQALRQDLPLNLLYKCPTISQLARAIEEANIDPSVNLQASGRTVVETVNLEDEVVLDGSIAAHGRVHVQRAPKGIFLTGATGFLGAFLLEELLRTFPEAVVRCLVRADNAPKAMSRIVTNLTNHALWHPDFQARIVAVVGDLALPRFGLSEEDFLELANKTDVVYHNGALVHWVYPYSKLKPMNVLGTIEALRLATAGRHLAALHFVSSTSVFDSEHYLQKSSKVLEEDDLSGGHGLSVGYAQSKWVSEHLVLLAKSRGVPVTIFRPGYITGHSHTGIMNIDDYLVRLLKGCIQLGMAPIMANRVNMCSVDFVAKAIVTATNKAESVGKCFHIWQPTKFQFKDYFAALAEYGYNVSFVDYLTWRDALMKLTLESKNNALYPLLHFVLDDLPTRSKTAFLDSANLDAALFTTGVVCQPIQNLMGVYLSFLVGCGYIDSPPRAGHDGIKSLPQLNLSSDALVATERTGI